MTYTKTTEQDSHYNNLENMSINEIITTINTEDKTVPIAVEKAISCHIIGNPCLYHALIPPLRL